MAVYTPVPAEAIVTLLERYDHGTLQAAKGVAEGVENTNYRLDTSKGPLFLTLYEKRMDPADLPFFLNLITHLADAHLPVPRALADRDGVRIQQVAGKPACLIEFLPGLSTGQPTPPQARATGAALGAMHTALANYPDQRPNPLGLAGWRRLAEQCGADLDHIQPGLAARIFDELAFLDAHWPRHLPQAIVHGDLFPDNVLMLNDQVTGLIDFYFAATEVRAWDLAVTHSAWAFAGAPPGETGHDHPPFDPAIGDALIAGYRTAFPLTGQEAQALPVLARGACLRFLLTRSWDWLNHPPGALVSPKDPLVFLKRLDFYATANPFATLRI